MRARSVVRLEGDCIESKQENQLDARVGPKTGTVWGKDTQ